MKPPAEKGRGEGRKNEGRMPDWFNKTEHYRGNSAALKTFRASKVLALLTQLSGSCWTEIAAQAVIPA